MEAQPAVVVDLRAVPTGSQQLPAGFTDSEQLRRLRARTGLVAQLDDCTAPTALFRTLLCGLPALLPGVVRGEVYLGYHLSEPLRCVARSGEGPGLLTELVAAPIVAQAAAVREAVSRPRTLHQTAVIGPLASVPLLDGTVVIGLVVVERERAAGDFEPPELAAFASVIRRIAPAVHRMRVLELCEDSLRSHLQASAAVRTAIPRIAGIQRTPIPRPVQAERARSAVVVTTPAVSGAVRPPVPPPPAPVPPPPPPVRRPPQLPSVMVSPLAALPMPMQSAAGSGPAQRHRSDTEDRDRVQLDLQMARGIQRRLLPELPRELSGLHLVAEYHPAFELGGDFYDLVKTGPGRHTAVIGDVSGKGVSAALIMSQVMAEFRRCAVAGASPAEILAEINCYLAGQRQDDAFVTATCIVVDASERMITVANAGHVSLVVRRPPNAVTTVGVASGAPLGLIGYERYRDDRFRYQPGDIVLMMTDGITEALDPQATATADASKLLSLVAECPHDLDPIARRLLAEAEISRGARRPDDVALLALRLE